MQRRQFMTSIAALSGGLMLGSPRLIKAGSPDLEESLNYAVKDDAFWQVIRRQFLFPEDYIYANTGGIGAVPSLVLHQVKKSLNEMEIHPSPGYDHDRWLGVKDSCTEILGPGVKKEELALTNTTTEGINIIINGLGLKKGDEIITSTHEHAALNVPLLNRMQWNGIVIKPFEPDFQNGLENVNRIEELISKKTKLIFISHVTCTTGQRLPEKEIGELAESRNILYALDGAQAAGAMPMDVVDWGVDFYAFSGHKWTLGPKRTGVLYVREDMLDILRPTTVGGYSDDGHNLVKQELKLHPTAQRYEYGTQNEALYHGLGKAIDFVKSIGIKRIEKHNRELGEAFYQGLSEIPDANILSPVESDYRTSLITFKIEGKNYKEIGKAIGEKNIRVRLVGEAGLDAVRVSFHIYNNLNEVNRILEVIDTIARA